MSGEYLTMAEIEKRYPNEWVLIDRPISASNQAVKGGHVVAHNPDRDHFDWLVMDSLSQLSKCIA